MSKTTAVRYTVPSVDGEGWGIVLFDNTGVFSAVTDFGNFAYWFSLRENESMEEFLISRRPDQILCKIAREDKIDVEETIKYIKEELLRNRRAERFTEEAAREEWKLIEELQRDLGDYSEEVAFHYFYEKTRIQFDDGFLRFKYPSAAIRFCNETFVRLQEKLKSELLSAAL